MSKPSTAPAPIPPTSPNRATRRAADPRKNLTSQEAADYLNISLRTLRNWLSQGLIDGHRVGPRLLRFDADDLDAAVSRL
jgi:excisionase family DNA binding protein